VRTPQAVDVIVGVLAPHIGETTARAATSAHCRKLQLEGQSDASKLQALLEQLRVGLNVFVGRERSAEVIARARTVLAAIEEAER
jgi:hypothetical protein